MSPRSRSRFALCGLLLALTPPAWGDDKDAERAKTPAPIGERLVTATLAGGDGKSPNVLLARKAGESEPSKWVKLARKDEIHSTDVLLTLPGFVNDVRTKTDVSLLMRGCLPEYATTQDQLNLLDSAVVLHANKDVDLDLTLLRGRIYLSNQKAKGAATVRLRFEGNQVWEITLDGPKTEVGVELWRTYSDLSRTIHRNPDEEDPFAFLELILINGEATVNVVNSFEEFTERARDGKSVRFSWDTNKFHRFVRLDKLPATWDKQPPSEKTAPKERVEAILKVNAALKKLGEGLEAKGKKDDTIAKALGEARAKDDLASRLMGVYCMGAIGDVNGVLDALGDNDPDHAIDRYQAAYVLRQWVARGGGNHRLLFDRKKKTGILVSKYKKEVEAETLYHLIFVYPPEKWLLAETFEELALTLKHKNVAIAELGWQHLVGLSLGQVKFPLIKGKPFNAAASLEDRKDFAAAVEELIEKKQLPPKPAKEPKKDKDK